MVEKIESWTLRIAPFTPASACSAATVLQELGNERSDVFTVVRTRPVAHVIEIRRRSFSSFQASRFSNW